VEGWARLYIPVITLVSTFLNLFLKFPFCAVPLRAPKWYKRPAGVSFGFGGKLVSFHPRASSTGSPAGASEVRFWC